jgi:hypothetical protein
MDEERLEELRAKVSACRGWTLQREFAGLARSYKVFLGNDEELSRYLHRHSELPAALELWSVENREGFERFLDEVDRLLHNYVASVGTLRDHTRNVWDRHPPPDPTVLDEYATRKGRTFATSGLAQFVLNLRNYALHNRLPLARGRFSIVPDESFEAIVFLEREELLKWNGWNLHARSYLESASEDVSLSDVVEQYSTTVVEFNTWLGEAFIRGHLDAFDELEELKQEYARAFRAMYGEPPDEA